MSAVLLVVILALVWAGITGSFSGLNLLFGGLVGGLAVWLLRGSLRQGGEWRKLGQIASLCLLFVYELMVSAIRVAWVVIQPDIKGAIRPAVIAVPLTVKSDAEIALLANLITLTPGTLSVDVSEDRSTLYVHALALSSPEALIAEIANGFEARIAEIYK
ncbi:MAG: Na+/H+ antiporter subunit E [Devosia sp.]|jgi:multicomponent Na+:H+ antiporter subunit E|uniref:Na+/H+ antiporter subunit E n=1 Tax=unclassified Devosia TaxID=196773 RepID=UPI0019E8B96B|nr:MULTISPECIES: Na+/H+ antiporter subunit E [unclassified Devosia]MBF0680917.1 Na+/H+ antiporter subunit E [Devosia sp.]WEJ32391.1 Na+/H+ antiporter subunit E [Devosia sp. SD17-2]